MATITTRIVPTNGQLLVLPAPARKVDIVSAGGIVLNEGDDGRSYLEQALVAAADPATGYESGDVIIRHKTDGHRFITEDGRIAWFMDARNVKAKLVRLTEQEMTQAQVGLNRLDPPPGGGEGPALPPGAAQ